MFQGAICKIHLITSKEKHILLAIESVASWHLEWKVTSRAPCVFSCSLLIGLQHYHVNTFYPARPPPPSDKHCSLHFEFNVCPCSHCKFKVVLTTTSENIKGSVKIRMPPTYHTLAESNCVASVLTSHFVCRFKLKVSPGRVNANFKAFHEIVMQL